MYTPTARPPPGQHSCRYGTNYTQLMEQTKLHIFLQLRLSLEYAVR